MRSKYIILFGLGLMAIFISVTHNGHGPMLGSLDVVVFRDINQGFRSAFLDRLASTASDIGSDDLKLSIYILSLCSVILLISIFRNSGELKKILIIMLIALIISGLIVDVLKMIFEVSRPYIYLNNVHVYNNGRWLDIIVKSDSRDSFPSGHAAITFTVLGVLWMYNRLRIPLLIFLFITMFLIVYVGQHYVSDIIAGAITGFMIGYSVRCSFISIMNYNQIQKGKRCRGKMEWVQKEDLKWLLATRKEYIKCYYLHLAVDNIYDTRERIKKNEATIDDCINRWEKEHAVMIPGTEPYLKDVMRFLRNNTENIKQILFPE